MEYNHDRLGHGEFWHSYYASGIRLLGIRVGHIEDIVNIYRGQYNEKSYRQGQGEAWAVDGGYYVGEWREGQKNGHGKYVYNDGESYEGGWKESMYHGKGLKTYSNGDC
jgi:hypothetical protein